uniref:Zeta toxin domain-containing protein n=1 Tax=Coccolithus braarudii TaxID=221442 RepID=A0A7S0Q586_9EUKA
MAGLPGAGKSTLIDQRYQPRSRSDVAVLDLDAEMARHPRFNPADPDAIYLEKGGRAYNWADRQVEERFQAAIANSSLRRIIVDGTGTNSDRQRRRMQEARAAGWFVKVLHVSIPLDTAVRRAAARARPVTARKVCLYHSKVNDALASTVGMADEFETFDAPSHDPPHILMREGFVQKSRTIMHELEDRRQRDLFAQALATLGAV